MKKGRETSVYLLDIMFHARVRTSIRSFKPVCWADLIVGGHVEHALYNFIKEAIVIEINACVATVAAIPTIRNS